VFGNALGDSIAAASSGIPGPVSADERSRILGNFADGPGFGSMPLRPDISATTADQLLADVGVGSRSYGGGTRYANASNAMRSGIATDAGGAAEDENWPYVTTTSDSGGTTVKAYDGPISTVAETTPQTIGDFLNTGSQRPYNPNWAADVVRYTLSDAIAQTARRNERVLTPIDPAAATARQRTINNLAGAMGGPFVGGPMQMARMAGLNEYQVQEAGILGMAAQDAMGMKGTGSATRLASGVRRTGGPRLIPNEALESNYVLFNKTHSGSMPIPKGEGPNGGLLQSHHGLQARWAEENLAAYGYSKDLAPTITIETGRGQPHTVISQGQIARRDARVAAGEGKWSSSLQQKLRYIVDDMRGAGFQRSTIEQVLDQQYKMLDKLNVPYKKEKW